MDVTTPRKPALALSLPHVIFRSQRRMDHYAADDMRCGDLTERQLKAHYPVSEVFNRINQQTRLDRLKRPGVLGYADALSPARQGNTLSRSEWSKTLSKPEWARILFDEFRVLSDTVSFVGPYRGLMRKMISHMQENSGSPFRDPRLDRALKEQIERDTSIENSSRLKIKGVLQEFINWDNGTYPLSAENEFRTAILDSVLPKFNRWQDRINGLGIAVHDIYATHITLQSLRVTGNQFQAVVHYRVQDHFGLDDADILDSFYRQFSLFRVWFVLQRWQGFGYRPFMTNMEATVTIKGDRNDQR